MSWYPDVGDDDSYFTHKGKVYQLQANLMVNQAKSMSVCQRLFVDPPKLKKVEKSSQKPDCVFGTKCYRRNPHHFREYHHQHLLDQVLQGKAVNSHPDIDKDAFESQVRIFKEVCKAEIELIQGNSEPKDQVENKSPKAEKDPNERRKSFIQAKLEAGRPLSFFLTKVKDSPATHRDMKSIYFSELLHPSLGKLKSSLQINFMVEWDWLKMNYEVTKTQDKPLLLIHGQENPELAKSNLPDHVRAIRVKPRFPFGTHHTKLMIFQYEDDSVRVVVSTANLIGSDWENRTQGLWVGPRCPKLESGNGDSSTRFRASLLRYLQFYELTPLRTYIDAVRNCDFSGVNVFFLGSVPNSHKGSDFNLWGHRQLGAILRSHVPEETEDWPIIMQCSSIGSLGPTPQVWLKDDFGRSLASNKKFHSSTPKISLIYPSKQNVEGSHDGLLGGGCLPYSKKTHLKQPWLENHLHQWRSDSNHRSKAMPHIKTYTKVNATQTKAAYFVLTSSNLSKAAWGLTSKGKDSLQIQSYEGGILFLPQYLTGKKYFDLEKDLKLPYDLPLEKYRPNDSSWFMDYLLL